MLLSYQLMGNHVYNFHFPSILTQWKIIDENEAKNSQNSLEIFSQMKKGHINI